MRVTVRRLFLLKQSRWTGQGVSFSTTCLPVTECGTPETLDGHFDQPFYTGELEYVFLSRGWLEDDIVGEEF